MTSPERRSIIDRMKDAAYEQIRAQQDEFDRIADLVIGSDRRSSRRVTEVINLGDDHLVEVTDKNRQTGEDETTWTFVIGSKASNWHHHTQEHAILHLIATRHDPDPNSNHQAAFYAGRVLGVPNND